jgi:hypothetical protein
MVRPHVAPRVEERDKRAAGRVDAGEVGPLVGIAAVAGQGEVCRVIGPAVLLGDDVFDVVRQAGRFLAEQAVFATVPSTLADNLSRRGIHHAEPFKPR